MERCSYQGHYILSEILISQEGCTDFTSEKSKFDLFLPFLKYLIFKYLNI